MQINIRSLLLLFILSTVSCSKTEDGSVPNERIDVTIGSGPSIDIETKSTLDPDGVTVKWVKGDKIAVWAKNSDGEYQFSAQPFVLWSFGATYDQARFTATIDPMPTATYDYLAVSPIPVAVDGTLASYSIPAQQAGVYNDAYDIRVAAPAIGKEPLTEGDNSSSVSFSFAHQVHLLRIRIPKNLLGDPIAELELTFPVPITGTLTVDASNPNAAPVLTEGSNILTIKPATPLEEGSIITAFIAPVEISNLEAIEFRAYSERFGSTPVSMPGKNFAAGRSTPIALNIPAAEHTFPSIELSLTELGENTLGENIGLFKISGPEGSNLGNGSNERTFNVKEAGEIYTFFLGRKFDPTNNLVSGQTFKASYESENAVVSNDFVMPEITTIEAAKVELAVPHLLEENFSRSSDFAGSSATGNAAGVELTSSGLPGWYAGARCQGYAGTCANLQQYSNAGGPYHSRLNTSKLTGIRPGKTLTIKLVFNSDWKQNKSGSMSLIAGRSTGTSLNDAINNITTISMSNNSSASRTNIPTLRTVTIPNLTSEEAISWKTSGSNAGWTGYFNYEDVFIDNIKVSIVKEPTL